MENGRMVYGRMEEEEEEEDVGLRFAGAGVGWGGMGWRYSRMIQRWRCICIEKGR